MSGETKYTYKPFGELATVEDDAANVTTILYDERGLRTDMYDPDMGHWKYDHNAFGELIWQRDAKGQEVDLAYDAAGRLDERVVTSSRSDTCSIRTAEMLMNQVTSIYASA